MTRSLIDRQAEGGGCGAGTPRIADRRPSEGSNASKFFESPGKSSSLIIITRAEARAAGLTQYFTGKLCPKEHVSARSVSTSKCLRCLYLRKRENKKKQRRRERPEFFKNREALAAARRVGAKSYLGAVCAKCGGVERSTARGHCLVCRRDHDLNYNRRSQDPGTRLVQGFLPSRNRGRKPDMSPAHVYVIVAGAHCKIGIAADPVERLSSVATGCPIPPRLFYVSETMPRAVASWVEKTVHLKLAACNTNLEWFEVSADEAKAAVQAAEFFA